MTPEQERLIDVFAGSGYYRDQIREIAQIRRSLIASRQAELDTVRARILEAIDTGVEPSPHPRISPA